MQRASRATGSIRIAALALTAALATSACLGNATPAPTSSSVPTPSLTAPSGTVGPLRIDLRKVAGGFDQPVFVTDPGDGTHRIFVVEQTGRIRIVRDGNVLPTPFLDISDRVSCCGERGLLGLAFAPTFGATSVSFFVDYTDVNGDTVIAEGIAGQNGDPNIANAGTVDPLLHIKQPFPNHNGGMLAFGPDGYLYAGLGDGGSEGDPQGNGQRLDTLLGKILRLDVTTNPGGQQRYVAPSSNPFVGTTGAKPEIWAYGLRNPWRFSFDKATGDLWIGDVGQDSWEEVDVARAADGGGLGIDYGWNRMEASHCFHALLGCDQTGLTLPVAEYGHGSGDCAVIGGYVYRGSAYPALAGTYLFSDECTGTIRAIDAAGSARTPVVLLESHRTISSFGEDEAGELYLTDLASGDLLQVVATSP
ncbi:MAG: hypothetical protein QOE66_2653 [Chloroflexota bacterium]|nr:hypothetical protein [Chloroflexota bacterium]